MIKKNLLIMILLFLITLIGGCTKKHTITFTPVLEEFKSFNQQIKPNNLAIEPNYEGVANKHSYEFLGWYLDDKLFDFNSPINSDLTLTAKWNYKGLVIDFASSPRMDYEIKTYLEYTHIFVAKIDELIETNVIYPDISWVESEYRFSNPTFLKGESDLRTINVFGGWKNENIYVSFHDAPLIFEPEGYYLFYIKFDTENNKFGTVFQSINFFPIPENIYNQEIPLTEQYERIKNYFFPYYLPPLN